MHSLIKKNIVAVALIIASVLMMSLPVFAAATGTHTPVTGITVEVSGATDNSITNGAITVTAKGSAGVFGFGASAKTATITVTNDSGETATVSFDWEATSINQLTIDGTVYSGASGSFSKVLAAGGNFTITITTAKNSTTNKLVMRNFAVVAAAASSNVTFKYNSALGSVTVDGTTVADEGAVDISSSGAALVATPQSGATFLGWIDADTHERLSADASYTFTPASDMTVEAVFVSSASSANAWFLAGGDRMYDDLNEAGTYAASAGTKTVVLLNSGTLPAGNYTIPSGVTLLIPYDSANTLITTNMGDYDILSSEAGAKTLYRQLTMPSGASITVASGGRLNIGSRADRQMTGQVGAYGAIKMDSGSNITVQNGATLYAWGYIFPGASGGGTVTIQNGGTVYEMLMSMDYPGSASTTLDLFQDNKIFPLRTFTLRNVEVAMTLEHGATETAFYHFYGTTAGEFPGYISFVGSDSSSVFQTTAGATLTKSYASGRQSITTAGNISLNPIAMQFKQLITVDVNSNQTSGFPLPSGYDILVASGTFTLNENVIFLEGSKITVAEGATADTNGKNIYVFAAADDAGSVTAKDVHGTQYANVPQDAVLDINGTLIASGGFYTSAGKPPIISSGKTGEIQITTAPASGTIAIKKQKSAASTYDVEPAVLKNGDGSEVVIVSNTTYQYCKNCDVWGVVPHECETAPTYSVTITWSQTSTATYTPAQTTYTWSPTDLKYTASTTQGKWTGTSVMTITIQNTGTGDVTASFVYSETVAAERSWTGLTNNALPVAAGNEEEAALTVTPTGTPTAPTDGTNEIVLGTVTITLEKGGT